MNSIFSSRHLGLLATSLLLGFVAAVYVFRPANSTPEYLPVSSVRLDSVPHYRVVSDPAELAKLAQAGDSSGPAIGVVSDAPGLPAFGRSADTPADPATGAPGSLGIVGGQAAAVDTASSPDAQSGRFADPQVGGETDPAIEELKDLGMAMVSGPGSNWFTLQTAYVPADDINLLKRRIFEASNAAGSRDGLFIYQASRDGRAYNGVCIRRFESGAAAKGYKQRLDRKLGYPTQVRSKKGLQKELGF